MKSFSVSCSALIRGKWRPNYLLSIPAKVFSANDATDAVEEYLDELLYDHLFMESLDNAYFIHAVAAEV